MAWKHENNSGLVVFKEEQHLNKKQGIVKLKFIDEDFPISYRWDNEGDA